MARPKRPWIVTQHGPIEQIDDNLWGVESQVPNIPLSRRMCIARMSDGKLAFFHAVPLDQPALEQVRTLGQPAYLVVGHSNHAVDAHAFAAKLGLKIYGPRESEAGLRQRVDDIAPLESFPADAAVQVESMPGTRHGDALMRVHSGGGQRLNLCFTDAVMNVKTGPLPMRLVGFTGGPKCPPVFKLIFTRDKKALRANLERLAALPRLARLVPCHGAVIDQDAARVLGQIAAKV
ncbi:MAG TPA: hypothetical protein VND93_01030 [Myxococcales bacterium]|jgi:hypothetical protein|nr:hypothetical protein [Myxococcales bacterium]